MRIQRRTFLKSSTALAGTLAVRHLPFASLGAENVFELPTGSAPAPVPIPHFPDRLHAFVWRNWTLVPVEKIAAVVGASPEQISSLGESMGLPPPAPITLEQQRRSYITIIRRNWHLLPYEQLLQLLDWTVEHMAYMLREDDFLFIKLGSLKPNCTPLRYIAPTEEAQQRARAMAETLKSIVPAAFSVNQGSGASFCNTPCNHTPFTPSAARRCRYPSGYGSSSGSSNGSP